MANDGFPERLKALRRQKNLSRTELGKLVGIHYNHIGRYERGSSLPTASKLKRLSSVLGVSGDYLLEGAKNEAAKAHFNDLELLRMFQEVETLDEEDKFTVKKLIDAFLTKKQLIKLSK